MKTIDDYFSSTPSTTLYHYTGIGGLLGMVENRKIWASNAYYLNDSKEILHSCDVLSEVLEEKITNLHDEEQNFFDQLKKWIGKIRNENNNIFIFSLTEEKSLLSQWRSYTPHGKGVSIGFSASILNKILESSGFRIAKCLYERQQHVELTNSILTKIDTYWRNSDEFIASKGHAPLMYNNFLEDFRGDLLQILSIIKHPAFREECEWRIVSPYFPQTTDSKIKFREGASMLMPYIEIDLAADDGETPLFEEVILGPSQHEKLSISALTSYLRNKKVCNIPYASGIPFRKW